MSAFVLKIIASVCMLIDHIGAVFPVLAAAEVFRLIGRIAFPIYAYMIAQGCKYTKNIYKYLLRLGIFALISEIPFDIAFMHYGPVGRRNLNINFMSQTNVFYSLFLGVACIAVYEKLKTNKQTWRGLIPLLIIPAALIPTIIFEDVINWRIPLSIGFLAYLGIELYLCHSLPEAEVGAKTALSGKILAIVPTVPIIMLGSILSTDYGMYAVIYIMLFYFAKPENRLTRTITMAVVVFFEYAYPYICGVCFNQYGISLFLPPGRMMHFYYNLNNFWFALTAVILVFLYNGKQGPKIKWAFYVFYPTHIAVLAAIWFVFSRG